ncbi:MAG: hypothetical protein ACK55Z_30885, partial [bacterium]
MSGVGPGHTFVPRFDIKRSVKRPSVSGICGRPSLCTNTSRPTHVHSAMEVLLRGFAVAAVEVATGVPSATGVRLAMIALVYSSVDAEPPRSRVLIPLESAA